MRSTLSFSNTSCSELTPSTPSGMWLSRSTGMRLLGVYIGKCFGLREELAQLISGVLVQVAFLDPIIARPNFIA